MAEVTPRAPVVLIVEDDEDVRSGCAASLVRAGFAVLEAEDAARARAIIERAAAAAGVEGRIDIVFSDINMPGAWDGCDLARWIAAEHAHLPVVLTSGGTERGDLDCAFIAKPYRRQQLLELLRELLAQRSR